MPKHATVYEQSTAPAGALVGALWIDSDTEVVQILTTGGWQEFGGAGGASIMAAQDPSGDWWTFDVDNTGAVVSTNVGAAAPTDDPPYASIASVAAVSNRVTYVAGQGGVACNGITDDTAAIQALINTAPAGTIFDFGDKRHNYAVTTLVPKTDHHYVGRGATLTKTGGTEGLFSNRTLLVPVANATFQGLRLIGQGHDIGTSSERRMAINIYEGTNIRVRDCYAQGFSYAGFAFSQAARNIWIEDNTLEDISVDGAGNAIHIGMQNVAVLSNNIRITGNRVKNCRTAPVCLQCSYDTTIPATYVSFDVTIADNPFLEAVGGASTGFAAIALELGRIGGIGTTSEGSRIRRVHVHHNTCYYTGPATNAWGIAVSDNNFSGGAQSTDPDEMAEILIDHNIITSSGGGINCQASRAVIDHNIVAVSGATSMGIYHAGNGNPAHIPSRTTIDANTITMPADGRDAIRAGAVDRPLIQGNSISYATGSTAAATGAALRVTQCVNPRIYHNTVDNAPRAGIYADLNTNTRIVGNEVYNPNDGNVNNNQSSGIYHIPPTPLAGREVIKGNVCADDRATKRMYAGIFLNNANNGRLFVTSNDTYGGTATGIGWNAEPMAMAGNLTDQQSFPAYNAAITVTASPFTFTNNHPYAVTVSVVGGTVTSIVKQRVNNTHQVNVGVTAGDFYVDAYDAIIVTYSAAPTMQYWPVK